MPDGRTIGVLAPLVAGPYFGAVLRGIATEATAAGAATVVVQTLDAALGDTHPGVPVLADRIGWERFDGVIVVVAAATDDYVTALHAAGPPVVLVSHTIAGLDAPMVAPDNSAGTRAAVAHLYAHGHRRIAFVGHPGQADLTERHEAYREAMAAHGLEPTADLFLDTGNSMESGGELAARHLIDRGLPSTAAVAGNDLNAIGFIRALQAAGYRVPEDQAVIGFDDITAAENQDPALSSVNQNVEAVGAQAVRLLLRRMGGEPVAAGRVLVQTSLVTRRTCGCSPDSVPDRPPPSPPPDGVTPREWLTRQLWTEISPFIPAAASPDGEIGSDPVMAACSSIAAAVTAAARAGSSTETLGPAVRALYALYAARPRGETGAAIIAAAQATARLLALRAPDPEQARLRLDDRVRQLALTFGEARARDQGMTSAHLQDALRHEYDISMELLRGQQHDPVSLQWLHNSPVKAGCLALWSDQGTVPRTLKVVSTFGPVDTSIIGALRGEDFPPAELVATVSRYPGHQVVVLPVRTDQRDWGVLAVVGPPESRTLTGRETYFQWAAMLSVALDYESMVDSLRNQRRDLALAYARERELAESIRSSEERYALAASAANDGLWDWDLETDSIYFSPRWKAMLGYDRDGIGSTPDEWLDRVHLDDAAALRELIDSCRAGGTDTLEHEHRISARDGGYRWVLCRALTVPGRDEPATRLVGSLTDITERRALEEQLRHQALYDTLTGLPNRALFLDRLTHVIARTKHGEGAQFAVLFCDLDGFKVVNDSLGHTVGDRLLRQVGERIRTALRASDTAARLGGDEFTVLVTDLVDLDAVYGIARKLQERICQPYELEGTTLVVTATIGIATSASGYVRAEDAVRDADIAMYQAKSAQRGSCRVFDASMREHAMTRLRVESELRQAIDGRQLVLHYQPIVRLDSGHVAALEALIRWDHPERGVVAPEEFLPVAQETGLIVPIGRGVIAEACAQLAAWLATDQVPPELAVSVNISHREFWAGGLVEHLGRCLAHHGLGPRRLIIEITEGVLMGDVEQARAKLQALHDLGLRLHVDDFGTGYSSLEALHRLPIDALKIDRSFISGLDEDPRSRELAHTIIVMGARLGIDVIAEGIETGKQRQCLLDLGCRLGQGFHFARPTAPDEVPTLLHDGGLRLGQWSGRPPDDDIPGDISGAVGP